MFKAINLNSNQWQDFIKDIPNIDIYYNQSYYKPLEKYQNSKIYLLTYKKDNSKICEVVQINDISSCKYFQNILPSCFYYDMETPYGYGGIYGVNINETSLTEYFKSKSIWAKSKGVICEFTRYNPLLNNYKYFNPITKTLKIKSTIYINLQSEDQIWLDLDSKNRNMIRKAMKNGIKIKQADTYNFSKIITEFKKLYNETMQRNNASDFYYFDDEYFNNFFESMKNNFKIFYAEYESKIIATSIFIFNNKNIHYYLSGSDKQYLQLAPNNLLLYEVAKWALSQGFEKFHLGGGVNDCDQLFKFKKQFNKGEFLPFYIGRTIYNQETFDYLVQLRQQNSNRFNLDKPFLIKYRQEEDDE